MNAPGVQSMRDVLDVALREIPHLLQSDSRWNSVNVNYHPPFVERLWTEWIMGHRIYLHRILASKREECLFHPHPWPSIMKVIDGNYEMGIGWGTQLPNEKPPPIAATLYGGGGFVYEMLDPNAWHYVRPQDGYRDVYTVMVTGKPWERLSHKAPGKLEPLSLEKRAELLHYFRNRFR